MFQEDFKNAEWDWFEAGIHIQRERGTENFQFLFIVVGK